MREVQADSFFNVYANMTCSDEFPMNSMNRQEIIAEGLDPVSERYVP
jgi:hypothetical protein